MKIRSTTLAAVAAVLFSALLVGCSGEDPVDARAGGDAQGSTAAEPDADGWVRYGAAFEQGTPLRLEEAGSVAGALVDGREAEFVVAGTAETVCPASGCWVDLVDGEERVRIDLRNADGSIFSIPTDAAGAELVADVVVRRERGIVTYVARGVELRSTGD